MKSRFMKLCSIALVLVLLVQMLPLRVLAAEQSRSELLSAAQPTASQVQVVGELPQGRGEYTKEYLLSNGLHMATVHTTPIHYQKDGAWAEIDNTLKAVATLQSTGYTNTAGVWNVYLPAGSADAVSITKDGHTLSFTLAGRLKADGDVAAAASGEIALPEEEAADTYTAAPEEVAVVVPDEVTLPAEEDAAGTDEAAPEEVAVVVPDEVTLPAEEDAAGTDEAAPEEVAVVVPDEVTLPAEEDAAGTDEVTLPAEEDAAGTDGASLRLEAANSATAQVQAVDLSAEKAAAQFPETVSEKLHSRLLYAEVFEGTAVVYDLVSNQVKESIIIAAYTQDLRGYRYTLNTGDMVPVLQESGEIFLYDSAREHIIMAMPAPYMVDAAGEISTDVTVRLTGSGSTYTLTYLVDHTWMADASRRYPVVLDPIVSSTPVATNIQDITVAQVPADHFTYYYGALEVGYNRYFGAMRSYIQFNELPALTASDVIVAASLQMYKTDGSTFSAPVEVHQVSEAWSSTTMTWDNQPAFDPLVEDYATVSAQGYYNWDITDMVQGWYAGSDYGLMLKAPAEVEAPEDTATSQSCKFYSSDYSVYQYSEKPTLLVFFRNNNGLESYWEYTALSAGRAGSGYINSFTGNLVWTHSDIGFGGSRMPVAITHVYNAGDSDNNAFAMGYGWRTNYNQRVYRWDVNPNYYVWEDSDGTRHYFLYESENLYKDEDGLELTLTTGGSGNEAFILTDKSGNSSFFDAYGRLVSQSNNQAVKSSSQIAYAGEDSLQIASITDGVGRKYTFSYENGLLSRISFVGKGETELAYVRFGYSGDNLTSFIDQDGETATLSYTEHHLLCGAQDIDGYRLALGYNTAEADKPNRVVSVAEYDGDALGGELTIEYAHNQTTFTDHNGNSQISQFNNWGNTVSVQDGQGRAQFAAFTNNDPNTGTGKGNQLALASKLQNTVGNVLTNGSFESGEGWSAMDGSAAGSLSSDAAYYGSKSQKLTASAATGLNGPAVTVGAGQSYTLSAWVKTGDASASLSLGGSVSETLAAGSDWTRLEVCYTNTTGEAQSVTPCLLTHAAGTVYMDCAQLEQAPTASRYNLVENGDFRGSFAWSSAAGLTTASASAAPELDNSVYTFTGDPTQKQALWQTVYVSGSAGDSFVLAGWAKGDAAPFRDGTEENPVENVREFGLQAIFHNTDGTVSESEVVRFNPDVDSSVNWQYAAAAVVAKQDYSCVEVRLVYDYNVNTVSFDGIQLYKEAYGSGYTYDEKGNVVSVVDLQKQITTYEYDANENLTGVTLPTGAKLSYTYDAYHNVLTATTETGVAYAFAYDAYGNNTCVSVLGAEAVISGSAVYTADGNYILSATDALGEITRYGYDENTGLLHWVQYPEDTEACRTEYSYDAMYRLASAEVDVAGQTLSATYTYSDDYLTAIQTASTTYAFTYGDFGMRSSVTVGSRTLAEYSYTGRDNYLSALDYGNGDKVNYTYDTQGRVTRQTYENGDTVSYKYDNSGALATVTDSATGRTTTYYYDFTDRLIKYVETGDGFNHTVGYEYDSINNLTTLVNTVNGYALESSYAYDADNRLESLQQGSSTVSYLYDACGRNFQQKTSHNGSAILAATYTYTSPAEGKTSGQVQRYTVGANRFITNYTYTYDGNGNILSVSDGSSTVSYVYDSANQLVRENDQAAGTTTLWTYDNAGNILTRTEYAYTTAENPGTPTDTVTYSYGDDSWGDLLTGYDGVAITYDAIGNPLTFGSYSYTWEHGRQLKTLSDGTTTWTYTYDADGMRTSASNGVTTEQYVYTGGQLTMLRKDGIDFYFTYDASGSPLTLTYGSTTLYYITNLQGDVIALMEPSGIKLVEYTYDAWGNPLTVTGTMAATLGQYNPLRYRGYVYDTATGLYYLQSRYYNPEIGRFINADGLVSTGQGLLGNNMFAYCNNCPILLIDPSGRRSIVRIILPGIFGGSESCDDEESEYGAAPPYVQCDSQEINCYAYVMGDDEYRIVPYVPYGKRSSVLFVALLIFVDAKLNGQSVRLIKSHDAPIKSNEYRIALRTGDKYYHLMMQHCDGTWSHKPGRCNSRLIKEDNPTVASWDDVYYLEEFGEIIEIALVKNVYDSPTIYFAVTKEE